MILCTAGLLFRATLGGQAFDELVHRDSDENDTTNHRELGLGGNVEEENRILYHLDHRRAADDASDCSFAAAKAAPAEHRSRNGIQLVKVPERRGLNRILIQREQHPAEARQKRANHIGADDHPIRIDAAETRRFLISTECEQVASIYRFVEKERGDTAKQEDNHKRHRDNVKHPILHDESQPLKIDAEPLVYLARDVSGDAAVDEQSAEGDDEGL